MRVTLFDLGPDEPSEMVVVVHHLVTDAFSFQITLEDLETAYRQLSRGEPVRLPPKTTSLKAWAERLSEYAHSPELRHELDYWLSILPRSIAPLPVDPLSHGRGGGCALWLSAEETKTLIYDAPRVYGTEINDVLLTALVRAFASWTGLRSLLVDLVSHGRDPLFPDVDLSRTSGWLASFFPVVLDLGEAEELAAELRAIKEQLRRIPTRGLGYNVLRYVSQDREVVDELCSFPQPQVRFNYVGVQNSASTLFSTQESFARLPISSERGIVAFGRQEEELELLVTGHLSQGQLRMVFLSGKVVRDPTIMEGLARNYLEILSEIIASCRNV
jgi:non-ribosomal peptide synthase protein (TIGR01720 family)